MDLSDAVAVICSDQSWDVQVNMSIVQQLYPGAVSSNLYLGELSCTGVDSGQVVTFTDELRACFTSIDVSYLSSTPPPSQPTHTKMVFETFLIVVNLKGLLKSLECLHTNV